MKNKFIRITILFFFLLTTHNLVYGQGWKTSFFGSASPSNIPQRNDIIEITPFLGEYSYAIRPYPNTDVEVPSVARIKGEFFDGVLSGINPSGGLTNYGHIPKSILMIDQDTLIHLTERYKQGDSRRELFISKLYTNDTVLAFPSKVKWLKPVFQDPLNQVIGADVQFTLDGGFISLGAVQSQVISGGNNIFDLFVVKSDAEGNIVWFQILNAPDNDLPVQIIPDADGSFWVLKNVETDTQLSPALLKLDASGNLLWETTLNNTFGYLATDMTLTTSQEFVFTGNNGNQDLFVLKTDTNGNEIWRQDYTTPAANAQGRGIIEDLQNNLVVTGRLISTIDNEQDGFIAKLTANGTALWERNLGKADRTDGLNDIVLTPAGDYLMGGFINLPGSDAVASLLVKTDTFGIIKGGSIKGNVFHDLDFDCVNLNELNLQDWKVQAVNDSLNYYGNTDANGNYNIPVQVLSGGTADYTVSVVPPSNYWNACSNDIPVSLTYLDTSEVDFPMQSLVECSFIETQLASSNFRPCEPATIYLNYCNTGTDTAHNASIEIVLDDFLSFDSASITPSLIDGQSLFFDLGNININDCGDFNISVSVDCDSVSLGDALCIDAYILPDTLCNIPGQDWSGALLQLDYTCEGDSIKYNIKNIGTNDMQGPLEYIIIEDAVLLLEGNFELTPQQSHIPEALPINGTVYHLVAPQEPNAPGPMIISLGANNCPNENNPILNQLPYYNGNPYTLSYCVDVIGSYDPNDKQAKPTGFGEEHNIFPNTDLQYTIRFQNTGTDTAFRVVIRDTLSPYLNPARIVPGPSSHPYEWRLEDQGHLSFNFYNIALPDSTTNLAASQGFVSFRIAQKANLATGTIIENQAGIYFDFNAPIITNQTFHTVTRLIDIVSGTVSVATPSLQVKVVPNPMQEGAWISLEGETATTASMTLRLYDTMGRMVQEQTEYSNRFWLNRNNLTSGMYFFSLEKNGVWQASGKIIVE